MRRTRKKEAEYVPYPRTIACRWCKGAMGSQGWCADCSRRRAHNVALVLIIGMPVVAYFIYVALHAPLIGFLLTFAGSGLGFVVASVADELVGRRMSGR